MNKHYDSFCKISVKMHLTLWKTKELFSYRDWANNASSQIRMPHYPLYCGKTGLAHHECNSGAARSLCCRNRFAFSCICCGSRFAFSCIRCLKPCNPNPDFSLWLSVFYHLVVSHATCLALVWTCTVYFIGACTSLTSCGTYMASHLRVSWPRSWHRILETPNPIGNMYKTGLLPKTLTMFGEKTKEANKTNKHQTRI